MPRFRRVPAAMIVERLDAPNAREFRLLPNRSLTPRGTRLLLGALGLTMFAVAGISAGQGNVYAPAFALVQLVAIAGCFAAVGRRLDCEERIALSADALTVERRTGAGSVEAARFHPYWVRLQTAGRRGARLVLSSHGRACEIGALLGADERAELAERLRQALTSWHQAGTAGPNLN